MEQESKDMKIWEKMKDRKIKEKLLKYILFFNNTKKKGCFSSFRKTSHFTSLWDQTSHNPFSAAFLKT